MLHKTEAPKGLSAYVADEIARGAGTAASRRILIFSLVSLRHELRSCHSDLVTANAAKRLIEHYVDNFRVLPWRSSPGEPPPEPYHVWLSEIMLQQTTVAAVRPRFERFIKRWPTIEALASARDEEVLSEWAGLGYYARARNLIACARAIATRGGFPRTAAELRQLPGIGAYTSAAVAAIAFGEKASAVDTNVERVIARLYGLKRVLRGEIEELVMSMLPVDRPGDFVQATMDLGAIICRPKAPRCRECPLAQDCIAFASGEPENFPERRPRSARPHRHAVAYWTERNGNIWLVRRPVKGLLGGMAALPGSDWEDERVTEQPNVLASVRHVFTHFSLDLEVVARREPQGDGWWQSLDRLHEVGLPTLYRKAIDAALECNDRLAA